jgi:hypothetical protein
VVILIASTWIWTSNAIFEFKKKPHIIYVISVKFTFFFVTIANNSNISISNFPSICFNDTNGVVGNMTSMHPDKEIDRHLEIMYFYFC